MHPKVDVTRLEAVQTPGSDRRGPARSAWPATIAISIALYGVLGAALAAQRPAALPPVLAALVRAAPVLIALINTAALVSLLLGWRAIRGGDVRRHRRSMLLAGGLIAAFLALYVTRVTLGGVKAFPGPAGVRTFVYLPVLAVHVVLSIVSVPLVVHNLLTGLTRSRRDPVFAWHRRTGRLAVVLWSVSLALGIGVYLLLNVLY